ncbi:MAG: hypothetical protein ACFFDN_42180, partial [Candidatus Hodarchaeota archaeon]
MKIRLEVLRGWDKISFPFVFFYVNGKFQMSIRQSTDLIPPPKFCEFIEGKIMCTTYHYNKISFWDLFSLILIVTILSPIIVFPQQSIWDSLRTEKQYVAALDSADEITFRRDFEYPFLLLLDKKQKEYYQDLKTIADRKDFIKLYWKNWNP